MRKSSVKGDVVIPVVCDDDSLSSKAMFLQIAVTLLAGLSVLSSGMGLGYPAITSQILLRDEFPLTVEQVSWFASITAIVCPIGGPLSGYFADKIGRRNSMMLLSVISAVSWLVIGFSSRTNSEWHFIQLMIGRAIIGIGIGMTTTSVVMYSSEVCHPSLRGRMTMLSSPFFTALGLLIIYFLGYLIPTDYRFVLISILANLSVISAGIGLGFPAITSQLLLGDEADMTLTQSQVSWFASVTAIACPLGGPLSGILADKLGRRNTLMLINIFAIISWIIIGLSSRDNAGLFFIELMIGRAIIGVVIGMITAPAVMYSSEICHQKLRGRLTVLSTPFFVAFGTLVAYMLGYMIPTNFRLVALISAGITCCTILILFVIPESPVFLISKNKVDEARNALALLRNLYKNDLKINAEIEKLKEIQNLSNSKLTIFNVWREFGRPALYKPFLIMLGFFFFQQFSGIFVIFVFAARFSLEAGVTLDAFLSTVIIGVVRCVVTVICAFACDKFGKKPLAIWSGVGMFVSMVGLAVCSAFTMDQTSASWLTAVFLYFFIFSGTLGILTLPFTMVAEMYPQQTRGVAAGITMSLAFLMSFANIKTFQTVFDAFGNTAMFSYYAVIALLATLFSIYVLPETKGKSFQQIEEYFIKK